MGEWTDNVATIFVVGGAIALIACGVTVAKPNLHGVKFEEGTCQILSASQTPFWSDLPTCSCGKNCQEEYPCLRITAHFNYSKLNLSSFTGTIHHNYFALDEECLFIPECDSEFEENAESVYSYFAKVIMPLVNYDKRYPYLQGYNLTKITYKNTPIFDCWGYDGTIYIDHEYTMLKVYLSLCIPAGCVLFGLLLSFVCGSSEHRDCIVELIGLPFICLATIIMGILECLGCFSCRCRKPECNCFKRDHSEPSREADFEIAVETPVEMAVRRRRRSLVLETSSALSLSRAGSFEELDLRSQLGPVLRPSSVTPTRTGHLFLATDASMEPSCPQEISYPSSIAPPSYNNVRHGTSGYDGYDVSFSSAPVAIITGPTDVSANISDLPPPPSYDEVVDY